MSGRVRMATGRRTTRQLVNGAEDARRVAGVDPMGQPVDPWVQPNVDPFPTYDRLVAAYERVAITLAAKAEKSGDPVDRRVADAFRELADAVAWDRS